MKKRMLSILLALVMCVSMLPMQVFAAQTDSVTVTLDPESKIFAKAETSALATSLLTLDDEGKVALKATNEVEWIDRLDLTGAIDSTAFEEFDNNYALGFYHYLESNTGKGGDLRSALASEYGAVTFTGKGEFTYTGDKAVDSEAALAAISADLTANWNEATAYLSAVFYAFDRDHPEVFWLSGESMFKQYPSCSYSSDGTVTYKQTVCFVLRDEETGFDIWADECMGREVTETLINNLNVESDAVIEVLIDDFEENMGGTYSRYAMAREIHDYLTQNNCYNSSADLNSIDHICREYISALFGLYDAEAPVCEGYARAFKVLCDVAGIPCVLVDGWASPDGENEPHMWNYVQMDDGLWYAVDVTWDDPVVAGVSDARSGYERETYFLVGGDTEIEGIPFVDSHLVGNSPSASAPSFINGPVLNWKAYVAPEGGEEPHLMYYRVSMNGEDNWVDIGQGMENAWYSDGTYLCAQVVFCFGTEDNYIELDMDDLWVSDEKAVELTYEGSTAAGSDAMTLTVYEFGDYSIYYKAADDTVYSMPVHVYLPDVGYFSSPEISEETYLHQFVLTDTNRTFYLVSGVGDIISVELSEDDAYLADCLEIKWQDNYASITFIEDPDDTYCYPYLYVTIDRGEDYPDGWWAGLGLQIVVGSDEGGDVGKPEVPGEITEIDSGDLGDGVYWMLTSDGILRVYGSGAMEDSYISFWERSYGEAIVNIIIEEGITYVGGGNFYQLPNLTSVSIAESVTSIGDGAFYSCPALSAVAMGTKVVSIGEAAFYKCTSLTAIPLGTELKSIGMEAFAFSGLTAVPLPEGLESIGESAFQNCDSLNSVSIPGTVTMVGSKAFYSCDSLMTVNFNAPAVAVVPGTGSTAGTTGDTATAATSGVAVGSWAFAWCGNLDDVMFMGSVSMLDEYTFYQCGKLFSVMFHGYVDSIGPCVFQYCSGLDSVSFMCDVPGFIAEDAFSGVTTTCFYSADKDGWDEFLKQKDIHFGGELTWKALGDVGKPEVPETPSASGSCGDNLTWTLENGVLTIRGTGAMQDCSGYAAPWSAYYPYIKEVVVSEGATTIGPWAFAYCVQMESVSLPSTLVTIDYGAFVLCSSLTEVTIPANVTLINSQAFTNCTSLSTVNFLGNAPKFNEDMYPGEDAFTNVTATVYYPGDNDTWTADVMKNYGGTLTWVAAGGPVTPLTQIPAPTDLTWGRYYYRDYENDVMIYAEYPGMISWKSGTFGYRHYIDINVYRVTGDPEDELVFCSSWYCGRSDLEYNTDHDFSLSALEEMESGTYYFTAQAIGDGETTMDSEVVTSGTWTYTRPTERLSAPTGLAWDGFVATWDRVSDGAVGGYAVDFYYSPDESGENLERVTGFVQYSCEGEMLSFDPTFMAMADMGTGYYWFKVKAVSADVNEVMHSEFSALSEPVYFEFDWDLDENGVLTIRGNGAVAVYWAYDPAITKVVIEEGITSIFVETFYGCENLSEVVIPGSVTQIDGWAFGYCESLKKITFTGDAPAIGEYAFDNVTATCYYPADNATWTEAVMQNYGGTLTWVVAGGDTETGCLLTFNFPADLCDVYATVANTTEPVYRSGDRVEAGTYLAYEITDIADGYRIKSVMMNGVDWTESFVNGAYGGMATKIRGDVTVDVELELIPEVLPSVDSVTLYMDPAFAELAADNVIVDDNTRFYGKAAYSDGVDYPVYYIGGVWEYSTDGTNWKQDLAWGSNRFDYWPGWTSREYFDPAAGDFFVTGSYDLRLRVIPKDLYTTGADVLSNVIHVNGGATGSEEPEVVDSGICGDDLSWELTSDGVLTISGSGAMENYQYNRGTGTANTPWAGYSDEIEIVCLSKDQTTIGDYAFYALENVTAIAIPDSVESIGEYAFWGCKALEQLSFGSGLKSIGGYSFMYCYALKSVNFGSALESIDTYAFSECEGLTEVVIPDSVTSLGMGAFSNCTALTKVELGSGVNTLNHFTFQACSKLCDVVGLENVTTINNYVFAGTALTEITIPDSVKTIGNWAFHTCASLTKVTFEGDAPAIGDYTFQNVTATCYYPADNTTWTEDVMQNYGGTLTWVAYTAGGDVITRVTVNFDLNTDDENAWGDLSPATIKSGDAVELPVRGVDFDRAYYVFKGWFTQPEGGEQVTNETPITEDCTLYAHWELRTTITLILYVSEILGYDENGEPYGDWVDPDTYTLTLTAPDGTVIPAEAGTGSHEGGWLFRDLVAADDYTLTIEREGYKTYTISTLGDPYGAGISLAEMGLHSGGVIFSTAGIWEAEQPGETTGYGIEVWLEGASLIATVTGPADAQNGAIYSYYFYNTKDPSVYDGLGMMPIGAWQPFNFKPGYYDAWRVLLTADGTVLGEGLLSKPIVSTADAFEHPAVTLTKGEYYESRGQYAYILSGLDLGTYTYTLETETAGYYIYDTTIYTDEHAFDNGAVLYAQLNSDCDDCFMQELSCGLQVTLSGGDTGETDENRLMFRYEDSDELHSRWEIEPGMSSHLIFYFGTEGNYAEVDFDSLSVSDSSALTLSEENGVVRVVAGYVCGEYSIIYTDENGKTYELPVVVALPDVGVYSTSFADPYTRTIRFVVTDESDTFYVVSVGGGMDGVTLSAGLAEIAEITEHGYNEDGEYIAIKVTGTPVSGVWYEIELVYYGYDGLSKGTRIMSVMLEDTRTGEDTQAPTVALAAPDSVYGGSKYTPPLTIGASDDVDLAKIVLTYTVNGKTFVIEELAVNGTRVAMGYDWSVEGLSSGLYTVTAVAYDAVGNVSESASIEILVDNDPPAMGYVEAWMEDGCVVLSWEAESEDLARALIYRYYNDPDNPKPIADVLDAIGGSPFVDDLTGQPDGYYSYILMLEDDLGNYVYSDPVEVLVDTTAPELSVVGPEEGSRVWGEITFDVTAEDAYGVDWVTLYCENEYVDADGTQIIFDTTVLSDGPITVTIEAVDLAGNTTEVVLTYIVDNVPAVPTDFTAEYNEYSVLLTWSASEPEDNVSYYAVCRAEVYEDGTVGEYDRIAEIAASGNDQYEYRDYTEDFVGTYIYMLEIVSHSLEYDETKPIAVACRDTVAPVVTVFELIDQWTVFGGIGSRSVASFLISSTDNVGVDYMILTYTAENGVSGSEQINIPECSYDLSVEGLPSGVCTVTVVAYDAAGNESEPASITITIDNDPPAEPENVTAEGDFEKIVLNWTADATGDTALYRIERNGVEISVVGAGVSSYTDNTAQPGVEYSYCVVAEDEIGNRAWSAVVGAQRVEDDQAPVILDIWPTTEDNVTFCYNGTVMLSLSDNWKLAKVEVSCGDKSVYSEELKQANETVEFVWDVSDLSGEQTLNIKVTDAAGNVAECSETVTIRPYAAPVIPGNLTAAAGFKTAALKWTYNGDLKTLKQFKVYSCDADYANPVLVNNVKNYKYTVKNLEQGTHYFVVAAEDIYGNLSGFARVEVYLENDDNESPVVVILPQDPVGVEGIAIDFSGVNSTDNDAIASYSWNFGDGTTGTGVNCSHAYSKAGNYTVSLTVTDRSENKTTVEKKVTVLDVTGADATHSIVTVTVMDGYVEGTPAIANATVTIYDEAGFETTALTDENGQAVLVVPNGVCNVAAAASGYTASGRKIVVQGNETGRVDCTVYLAGSSVKTVDGSLTVEVMTYDEIVAAGIDTSDPANNQVVKTAFVLEFQATPELAFEIPVVNYTNRNGERVGISNQIDWYEFEIKSDNEGGSGTSPQWDPSIPMKVGVFPITERFYLVIYGETHWLKEMFNVELIVINNSYAENITDCIAELELPEGLSLASMLVGGQSPVVSLGDIGHVGNTEGLPNQVSTNWYVRGDKEGEYNLTASVTGNFTQDLYNKTPFSTSFTTPSPIKVYAGSALKLFISAQDTAYYNTEYYVQFKLQNVSDRTLYNVSFGLTGAEQYRAEIQHRGKEGDVIKELDKLSEEHFGDAFYTVEEFKPGDAITINFCTKTLFLSKELEAFADEISFINIAYKLQNVFVMTLEGSTTEIPYEVEILPVAKQSFAEWLWEQTKENVGDAIKDGAVQLVDATFFGGIPVTENVVKVFEYAVDAYEKATNTADSYMTITLERGAYFDTGSSTWSARNSQEGVRVYTDGEYEVAEDGSIRLYGNGKLYVERTGATVDENGNEIEPQINVTTSYVDGLGAIQEYTYSLMEAEGESFVPDENDLQLVVEEVYMEPPVGPGVTYEEVDGEPVISVEKPSSGEKETVVTFPYALRNETGNLVAEGSNVLWQLLDASGNLNPEGMYLDQNGNLTIAANAKPGDYTVTLSLIQAQEGLAYAPKAMMLMTTASEDTAVTTVSYTFTLTNKEEESEPEVEYTYGQNAQIRLIEPWGLKANAKISANGSVIDYNSLYDYGAYFIRASKLDTAGLTQNTITVADILNDTDAVKYGKSEITFTGDYMTATYDKGLYTYEFSDSVFVMFYFVTEEGAEPIYVPIRERNLSQLIAERKDDAENFPGDERAVYGYMNELEINVLSYRADFVNPAVSPVQKAPTLSDYSLVGTVVATAYDFSQNAQIRLIEPWGLRLNAKVSSGDSVINYASMKEYGIIAIADNEAVDGYTQEELLANGDAYVFSSKNGDAVIRDGYISADYTKDFYTYQLDSNIYVMAYVIDANDNIHFGPIRVRNIYALLSDRVGADTGYTAKEQAVYASMIGLYETVTAYRAVRLP